MTADSTYEYELIDISFEQSYELSEEESQMVHEDEPAKEQLAETEIEYDAEGIPKGRSKVEIKMRRQLIYDHIQRWRIDHGENPRVFNENLNDYIKINQVFMLESVSHAASSYKSTRAVLQMEEVMRHAKKIGLTRKKEGNSNQKPFQHMLVMRYNSNELGNVKMTVGIRIGTKENVQYSITVPSPETPFIDKSLQINKKTKNRKKHPK